MKWLSKRRLVKLLSCSDGATPALSSCKADAVSGCITDYKNTGSISMHETAEIYERRFAHVQDTGRRIDGFEDLMNALRCEADADAVVVHTFSGSEYDYFVFTNPSVTKIIGVLRFVKVDRASKEV